MSDQRFFVTAAAGTADLLAAELAAAGASDLHEGRAGVFAHGTLEVAYRTCLWSRVGLRVLWPVADFAAAAAEDLYEGASAIDWSAHLGPDDTLAVDVSADTRIIHTRFAAQRVKDAVVDQFRQRTGRRPSVDLLAPRVRLHLRIDRGTATASIDLSGDSLHRRGYRERQVAAPLKENLAAAILLRAGWPGIAEEGGAFVDPMCGSGTLPIEAALIAGDIAPGLLRTRFGFEGWFGHDAECWQRLRREAEERRSRGRLEPGRIEGYDRDAAAIRIASGNARRAGVAEFISFRRCALEDLPPARSERGLVAVNPPYGERIGQDDGELRALYETLGRKLREGYEGWQAAVFTGNPPLGRALGIEARRSHRMFNGPIECRLLRLDVRRERFAGSREPGRPPVFDEAAARARPGAQMFANRLAKNLRQLAAWARREQVSCFRIYDADMPEYAFAIDLYRSDPSGAAGTWLYVQEYAAPAGVDPQKARARREEALSVLGEVTGVARESIYLRTRRPQKGRAQYGKVAERGEFEVVEEDGLRFLVNFTDYLDTGVFLDHRLVRRRIRELASGKRFLNLFGYTGTATVYAAAGGATRTLTLDLSRTYLEWARRNLELNGLAGPQHELERADCVEWLAADDPRRFDLGFLDPPTFSTSKSMSRTLDVQRDHVVLINGALRRLAPGGLLIFSTNLRRFRLDREALEGVAIEDWTQATLPKDYSRSPRLRSVFALRRAGLG